jgi:hypothetical protein
MTDNRKSIGDAIRVQRTAHSMELYGEAVKYGDYAKMFETDAFSLRKGLYMMFRDAAASANDRAYDAARGYGHFAFENASTPKECEIDAKAFIAVLENRANMPREEFRQQVQFYANKALDKPRYELPVSERERVQLKRDVPRPKPGY